MGRTRQHKHGGAWPVLKQINTVVGRPAIVSTQIDE